MEEGRTDVGRNGGWMGVRLGAGGRMEGGLTDGRWEGGFETRSKRLSTRLLRVGERITASAGEQLS